VAWFDHVGLAGFDLRLGTVVVGDVHASRLEVADVMELAAVAADDRLDALRPAPPRLQGHPPLGDVSRRSPAATRVSGT